MTKKNGPLYQFFLKHAWQLLVALVIFAMAWSNINTRVQANEDELDRISNLMERVIVLEESEEDMVNDIREIKEDIKDIKRGLNIK